MSQKMGVAIYGFKNRITQQDCTALLWEDFPECFVPASTPCPIKGPSMKPSSRPENASFPDRRAKVLEERSKRPGEVQGIGPERTRHTELTAEKGT